MKRTITLACIFFCTSFGATFAQSSTSKYWNVHDCVQAPSACVSKDHTKEAYGESIRKDGHVWSPSVYLLHVGKTVVYVHETMPDNQRFIPKLYQFDIPYKEDSSRWYTMVKIRGCDEWLGCYSWHLQAGSAPAEVLQKFKSLLGSLAKQDKVFEALF